MLIDRKHTPASLAIPRSIHHSPATRNQIYQAVTQRQNAAVSHKFGRNARLLLRLQVGPRSLISDWLGQGTRQKWLRKG
ncbi:MAG: hypothetical protein DSY87_08380 [Methylococcus sp.]|nr:MAG: hypothetical protein DSY87_08380 [Methylococcus sp.]